VIVEDVVKKAVGIAGLLQKGQAVGDPEKWKTRQIKATMVSGFVLAAVNAAKAFGVDFDINVEAANAIGVAVIAVFNGVMTVTTSKTVGIESKRQI